MAKEETFEDAMEDAKAFIKGKLAQGWTDEHFARALKRAKETISLKPNKEIHVMGDSEILCTISQSETANDMVISFEYESPSVTVETMQGEHGPYLVVKVHY